ncbi:hypothetical protein BDN72DRAFT_191609 [Pluteus cervinus]|uniref:Uncharacterized protein n=1 Tax=Pluteus cervinus TaxID=181527 RepID=A0ACD3AL19_9AGAR|nr:hypothetical protein BDN72DRAFT_191609 [Pluteus cervinus]
MATQSPGFSRVPQRSTQSTRRVTFVAELDKPPQPRSTPSRYSWPTFSEVIFHHARFIPPSPAPVHPPPRPPSSPQHTHTRPRRRKSRQPSSVPKHWSMKTIYNHENVDGDITAYLQAPSPVIVEFPDSRPSKHIIEQQTTQMEEIEEGSHRHRYFHAVILCCSILRPFAVSDAMCGVGVRIHREF